MLTRVEIPIVNLHKTAFADITHEDLDNRIANIPVEIDMLEINELLLEKQIRNAKKNKKKTITMYRCNYYFTTIC